MKNVILLCVATVIAIAVVYIYICLPEWSKDAEESMSLSDALVYCQKLRVHGHTDWRLPKSSELAALSRNEGNYWAADPATKEDTAYFYNFETKQKEEAALSTNMRVVCVRRVTEQTDPALSEESRTSPEEVCLYARKTRTEHSWKFYLEMYPNGVCADEAKAALDKAACEKAKELNTDAAKNEYFANFPAGKCVFESENETDTPNQKESQQDDKDREEPLQHESQQWSKPVFNISWRDAEKYCRKLKEGGYNDWRLPNIDELRTLVQDRKTASGGECRVSQNGGCLYSKLEYGCWNFETCAEACDHSLDNCSKNNTDGKYSIFGDKVKLWSSTATSDNNSWYWYIDFSNGLLSYGKSGSDSYKFNARCVR